MMIKKGEVLLSHYNENWLHQYLEEEKLLRHTIGQYMIQIEHVGSTSIVGLKAKPIIDIVIGMKELEEGYKILECLKEIGYVEKGSLGKSKRFFLFKIVDGYELYHLHLVKYQDQNWKNLIGFRDYLINHVTIKEEYQDLKEKLVKENLSREEYTRRKLEFILSVLDLVKDDEGEK